MKRQLIYSGFERFWHWLQAALILFLGLTGFEIHGSVSFFGFEQATRYHNAAAITLLLLIAFAIFWHMTTGEWRQYLLTRTNLKAQIEYYLFGIFRNAPHPSGKSVLSKLNPLQKIVYAGLKIVLIPSMVISGLLYMFYRYPQRHEVVSLNIDSLGGIAVVHTLGAFLMVSFIIAHVYLITTGQTVTSNLRAMITGYEELPEHPEARSSATGASASAPFQGERA